MIPFAALGLVRMWRRKITILPVVVPIVIATVRRRDDVRHHPLPRAGRGRARARGVDRDLRRVDVAPRATASEPRCRVDHGDHDRARGHRPAAGAPALHTMARLRQPEGRPFVRGLVLVDARGRGGAGDERVVVAADHRLSRATTATALTGDSFYYHSRRTRSAAGEWFVDPIRWFNTGEGVASAAHPPLYSTVPLGLWSTLGIDTVTGHRLASSLLGIAAVAVIGLLGYRLAGPAAGLVAAGITAIYPQLWINDGVLLSESIVVLVIACALHAMYSFWQHSTLRNACVLGAVCGIAALGRNELILLFPVVAIPLALRARDIDWRARIRLAVVACLAGAVFVMPWAIWNLTRFNEPTLTSSSLGSVLSAANCDSVYYGSAIGFYDNCFQGPWPTGDESERDAVPREQAIQYMKDHVTRLPVVVLARVGRVWGVFKPGQTTLFDWSIEHRGRAPSWAGLFSYYLLLPFAGVGLVSLWRRRISILPLVAGPVIVTFSAATTFGVTRYRAPAEVAIVLAAAVGVVATVGWLRARRPSSGHRQPRIAHAPRYARQPMTAGDPAARDPAREDEHERNTELLRTELPNYRLRRPCLPALALRREPRAGRRSGARSTTTTGSGSRTTR